MPKRAIGAIAAVLLIVSGVIYLRNSASPADELSAAVSRATNYQLIATTTKAGSPVSFVIRRTSSRTPVLIRLVTADGTAKAGTDYDPKDMTLTLKRSDVRISVPTRIDSNALGKTLMFSTIIYVNGHIVATAKGQILEPASPKTTPTPTPAPVPTPQPIQTKPVPAPTPTPTPTPVPTPTLTLGGEASITDNFDVNAWFEPGESPHTSPDDVGAFRFTCLGGQLRYDDPIVKPGQPGASHLHQFFGNLGTTANSTYQTLRTTGGSSCTRSTDLSPNRSAYWIPAMLDGAGNAIKADWMNTYYKQLPPNDPNCAITLDPSVTGHCVHLPNGVRFIAGYNMTRMNGGPADSNSRDWWAMGFDCVSKADGGTSFTGVQHTIADIVSSGKCPTGQWLRVFISLPGCWDGMNVDSSDHRSHVVYPPQAICPGDHPYRIPGIAMSVFYTTDANFAAGNWRLSSDDQMSTQMGTTVVPGTTLHADYWEAWSPVMKNLWETNCIDGHLSCSTGNLGNGQEIKGMQQVGPFPSHELVPLTSIPH